MGSWIYGSGVQRRHEFVLVRIYIEFIAMNREELTKGASVGEAEKRCKNYALEMAILRSPNQ